MDKFDHKYIDQTPLIVQSDGMRNHQRAKLLLTSISFFALAQIARAETPQIDQQADRLMSQMSQDEKISLIHGVDSFYTNSVDHLKIPRFKMTDGPVGTRNDGPSTAYPAGVLLAATWDPHIAELEGISLGRDARSRGDHILLGPGVNICRQPQNGRNFEYLGEDPFLAGQIDVGYIKGVQSQGVAACVKHYACNNQETARDWVNVHVDERTLHEIYLPAFEAAVKQGHVRSIMASYNKVNGDYASANHYLLTDVLRTEWGFDGIAMSDWGAVHETLGPITAGLDLEMPDPKFFNPEKISPLLESGKITQAMIDQKVRHILHVAIEMGWLDRPQKDATISHDDDTNDAVALAVAREGIVLLKNQDGILPLDRTKLRNVVVVGNDEDRYVGGGGSSYTQPARPVTILAGLKALAGSINVISIPTGERRGDALGAAARASRFVAGPADPHPLQAEFFNNTKLEGEPVLKRGDDFIDFNWKKTEPASQITTVRFSARWKGTIRPIKSGNYRFEVRSDDGSRVMLDGKQIIDNWRDQQAHTETATVGLEAGHDYPVVIEYFNSGGEASMQFAYSLAKPMLDEEQMKSIAAADAAIVCVHTDETEGNDRPYDLKHNQNELIQKVSGLNKKVIVVLEAGGSVAMQPWIDQVPALVDAWYPGQAGGKALAEILFGDINPSGHLPDSFEKDWSEAAAFGHYPGKDDVEYTEGLYVGYRWFDKKQIVPRFPFGFGMSYTTFDMKNVKVVPGAKPGSYLASVDVINTGEAQEKQSCSFTFVLPLPNRWTGPFRN